MLEVKSEIFGRLGDGYVDALFGLYRGRVPAGADLVAYWFEKAREAVADGQVERVGLIATQAIRGGANRTALKRIQESGNIFLGWADESQLVVVFPELSEERRKDFIKVARHKAEDSRVSIRNIRRHAKDSLDKMVKSSEAGEDEVHRAERELDELTHTYVGQVDELLRHKEAELLEV